MTKSLLPQRNCLYHASIGKKQASRKEQESQKKRELGTQGMQKNEDDLEQGM